jgi:DNA-binding transcriptional ArsR family regulator
MAYEKALVALADPTRRSIVETLKPRPLSVGALAARMPVSRPAVSQHLKVLKEAGLVMERREGTRHYFALDPTGALELREYAERMWERAMRAYALHVAAGEKRHARR